MIHSHLPLGAVPVGTVCAYLGMIDLDPVPAYPGQRTVAIARLGWLPCLGQALPIAAYPELYGALGTLYGTGTDAGTFKLPDCRGMFLRGFDNSGKIDPEVADRKPPPGASVKGGVGSTQAHALETHTHGYNTFKPTGTAGPGAVTALLPTATPTQTDAPDLPAPDLSSKETRPINIAVHYLIRAR